MVMLAKLSLSILNFIALVYLFCLRLFTQMFLRQATGVTVVSLSSWAIDQFHGLGTLVGRSALYVLIVLGSFLIICSLYGIFFPKSYKLCIDLCD